MTVVEVTEEDISNRTEWRRKIRCGDKPGVEEECVVEGRSCVSTARHHLRCGEHDLVHQLYT